MPWVPERAWRVWLGLALGLSVWACGGNVPAPAPVDDPTLERAEAVQAARRAPDLWQRAERAAALSREAPDSDAAEDFLTEARLWRQAAIAEAERIDALQKQAPLKADIERQAKQLAALRDERARVHAQAERLAAGRLALAEATRVLELSADDQRRRPRLSEAELRQGAAALLDRARLVIAAAQALGADQAHVDALRSRAAQLQGSLTKAPTRTLHGADVLLFDAHASLGPLREGRSDPAARQTLYDALGAAGFELSRSERGLHAGLAAGSPGTARKLQRLCKLREAFPAGAWQVVASRATLSAWKRQLTRAGCTELTADWQSVAPENGNGVEIVWLGY